MKRLFSFFLALGLVVMNSCDFATLNNGVTEPPVDTVAMIAKINSFETQPIDRIEVFQVLEGRDYSKEYRHYYHSCLARTYKNKKEVNSSALIMVFDESVLLYNDLEIKASDYVMTGTYSYDTKPENFFGMEIPSRRLTVPIYVRKSELLGLFGVVLTTEQPKTNKPRQKQPENKPVQQPEENTRALFRGI